jgi:hypothetical protein
MIKLLLKIKNTPILKIFLINEKITLKNIFKLFQNSIHKICYLAFGSALIETLSTYEMFNNIILFYDTLKDYFKSLINKINILNKTNISDKIDIPDRSTISEVEVPAINSRSLIPDELEKLATSKNMEILESLNNPEAQSLSIDRKLDGIEESDNKNNIILILGVILGLVILSGIVYCYMNGVNPSFSSASNNDDSLSSTTPSGSSGSNTSGSSTPSESTITSHTSNKSSIETIKNSNTIIVAQDTTSTIFVDSINSQIIVEKDATTAIVVDNINSELEFLENLRKELNNFESVSESPVTSIETTELAMPQPIRLINPLEILLPESPEMGTSSMTARDILSPFPSSSISASSTINEP